MNASLTMGYQGFNNYPKISIVTPSYNQCAYLEQTILSVINQNYPNLEYIIIDGGSTDASVGIIKKYEKHLKYWVSEKDNGLYDALNKGFKRTTGEIMGWLNSDDILHKGALSVISEIFYQIKEVKWITGLVSVTDEKERIVYVDNFRKWSKYNYFQYDIKWIQQESTYWHRELWEKAGSTLNTELSLAADLELWLRFFKYEKVYSFKGLIGAFRMRSHNQKSLELHNDYISEAFKCIGDYLKHLPKGELAVLKKIKLYNSIKKRLIKYKISVLNKKLLNLHQYPRLIYFNRVTQSFELEIA